MSRFATNHNLPFSLPLSWFWMMIFALAAKAALTTAGFMVSKASSEVCMSPLGSWFDKGENSTTVVSSWGLLLSAESRVEFNVDFSGGIELMKNGGLVGMVSSISRCGEDLLGDVAVGSLPKSSFRSASFSKSSEKWHAVLVVPSVSWIDQEIKLIISSKVITCGNNQIIFEIRGNWAGKKEQ